MVAMNFVYSGGLGKERSELKRLMIAYGTKEIKVVSTGDKSRVEEESVKVGSGSGATVESPEFTMVL
jgi:hypothetical protein